MLNDDFEVTKIPQESGFEDLPVGGWSQEYCRHPSHEPPMHLVIPEGKIYRHVCPGCGRTIRIGRVSVSL